jgi:hypothetical protein
LELLSHWSLQIPEINTLLEPFRSKSEVERSSASIAKSKKEKKGEL